MYVIRQAKSHQINALVHHLDSNVWLAPKYQWRSHTPSETFITSLATISREAAKPMESKQTDKPFSKICRRCKSPLGLCYRVIENIYSKSTIACGGLHLHLGS